MADTAAPAAGGAGGGAGATKPKPKPAGGMAGLFASIKSIDQSSGKTAGLKHVTKDMKSKAKSSVVKSAKAPKPPAPKKKRLPVENKRKGMNWHANNFWHDSEIVTIKDLKISNGVVLRGNEGTAFNIECKVKSVTIENCKNCKVYVQSVLSQIEVTRCKKVQVYIRGACPTMAIDMSDAVNTTLSAESMDINFATSMVQGSNISFPDPENDGEFIDVPIPEQYEHKIKGKKLSSEVSHLYSS